MLALAPTDVTMKKSASSWDEGDTEGSILTWRVKKTHKAQGAGEKELSHLQEPMTLMNSAMGFGGTVGRSPWLLLPQVLHSRNGDN